MATLPKLTGDNWYEWKKEIETYFLLIGCGGHVGSTRPLDEKRLEWDTLDQKVYAIIWFHLDPSHRSSIITTNSGKEAWTIIVTEYQKDSPTNRILLRRQFYSLTHDPALPISQFIDDVASITRKLHAIGHKPNDVEVSDKILIGLDPSWSTVRTTLMFQAKPLTVDEITAALRQYEANESSAEEGVKREPGESALYAKGRGGGSRQKAKDHGDEGFDWGNSKNREGVCWRCGRSGHIAQFCVADMPENVKREILDRSVSRANIAVVVEAGSDSEEALFAFASAYTNPSLSDFTTTSLSVVPKEKKNRRPRCRSKGREDSDYF